MIELRALQGQVKNLVEDLRRQVAATPTLRSDLLDEYQKAKAARRTSGTFESWLEDALDQAAVAWVLGCVFVRFCEDNRLVEGLWLGGPAPHALAEHALQRRQAFLTGTTYNERDWIYEAFEHLGKLRGTAKMFDEHNPLRRFKPSADAADALADFFRRGAGFSSFTDPELDTRFLGDLYQDLSEHAKKTYALLQTPVFVEEFILDRAFEPALKDFGLADMKVIDPTCGSGHFLLGAFERLLKRWKETEPATSIEELVDRALAQVTGIDINPFAVAIARFRLVVAALNATGRTNLDNEYPIRAATGDSLLPWGDYKIVERPEIFSHLENQPVQFAYKTEDADLLPQYLRPNQYTVVLGNPPYITVKDKALNKSYRDIYKTCSGKYAMTVPFAERFFGLAKAGDHDGRGAGWVGQITSNSFMKREFGKKLINEFFARQVELTEAIDTSGAYVPGHGTPTVILVGRNSQWKRMATVRTVLGIRGEPGVPDNPAKALVWTAIEDQIDSPGSESAWISVAELGRDHLARYPWSLSGGGVASTKAALEGAAIRELSSVIALMGFVAITAEDEAFFVDSIKTAERLGRLETRPMVEGDSVRDHLLTPKIVSIWPYDSTLAALRHEDAPALHKFQWPNRRVLQRRKRFGTLIESISTMQWHEFGELYREKLRAPLSIAYAEVATHNHFVLDRGGKVFNRTAPVIKLSEEASEDAHLELLGMMNSSTACFWLKQVSHEKGGSGIGRGIQPEDWMDRYQFNTSKLLPFPLPEGRPLGRARAMDSLAQMLAATTPAAIAADGTPTRARLADAHQRWEGHRTHMIALQEELDWEVYRLYGLTKEDLTTAEPPEIALGERAFEFVLARKVAAEELETQWFDRHGSTAITELPGHWPADYQELVQRRIELIESDRHLGLLEKPENKRRWATEGWESMQTRALREWLLDRLESSAIWSGVTPLSVAQLADRVALDEDFRQVLAIWLGTDNYDLTKALAKLMADEWVPYLPADRYKPTGLRKRAQWERTWALQRREDAGETVEIEVPPKYTSADFAKSSYWRARGKLDVPKERFIWYPQMGRDGDGSELLGWAGWDHLGQARALTTVYLDRKTQAAWPRERLLPMLAGLAELEPWLHQWHAEPAAGYVGSPAEFFTTLIDTELSAMEADRAALAGLRGVEVLS